MADSVRTNLRTALSTGLKTITVANGYRTNIREVYDPWVAVENLRIFPSVNLYWGREERWDDDRLQGNNPLLDIRFMLTLDVFLDDVNNLPLRQDKVLADVQEYFGKNWWVPSSGGDATAFNCVYLASEGWGPREAKPKGGITIELQVYYSINLRDPESMIHP